MLIRLLEPTFSDRWLIAGEVLRVPEGHPLVAGHKALRMDDDAPIFACAACGRMFVSDALLAQHGQKDDCILLIPAEPQGIGGDEQTSEGGMDQGPPALKKHGRRRGVTV